MCKNAKITVAAMRGPMRPEDSGGYDKLQVTKRQKGKQLDPVYRIMQA